MTQEKIIPVKWDGWDSQDTSLFSFYGATFTEDWGKFKKDEKFSSISVDYSNGIVEAYSEDGMSVEKTQKFICIPVE